MTLIIIAIGSFCLGATFGCWMARKAIQAERALKQLTKQKLELQRLRVYELSQQVMELKQKVRDLRAVNSLINEGDS